MVRKRTKTSHAATNTKSQDAKSSQDKLRSTPAQLPPVLPVEIIAVTDDGDLIAAPSESRFSKKRGKTRKDITDIRVQITIPEKIAGSQKIAAGVGDRYLIRVKVDGDTPYATDIIRKIGQERERILAIIDMKRGVAIARPVDRKARDIFAISKAESMDAKDGDLVWVERYGRRTNSGSRGGKVVSIAGNMETPGAYSLIALASHDIPVKFSEAVIAESEAVHPPTMEGREDLREVGLLTIDPHDAKDHDDAVVAWHDEDPKNPDGFRVIVAIADVSWFVRPGSALDDEAVRRGNSVYLPDRVVPMLPERLSNDLCSLRMDVDRPCLAVEMVLNADGQMTGHKFMRAMMRSAAKLSYEDAQAIIEGADGPNPDVRNGVNTLNAAYQCRLKERKKRSPLELELAERKVLLNDKGLVRDVVVRERFDAHKLIEEFMILANVAAAQALEKARLPLIYRVHDTPDIEKLQAVRTYLETLDYTLAKGGSVRPSNFNQILKIAEARGEKEMISDVILRTQRQAIYDTDNLGHFGLNLARYAHFTSPIRRYADLTVHRALVKAFNLGDGGQTENEADELSEIASNISTLERRAMLAERESSDRYLSEYLSDKVGVTFPARIRGVTRFGLFVMLDQSGADGFIPMRTLRGRGWTFDEEMNRIVDFHGGVFYRLGQAVEVKLKEAAPVEGGLLFEIISDPLEITGRRAKGKRGNKTPKSKRDHRQGKTDRKKEKPLTKSKKSKPDNARKNKKQSKAKSNAKPKRDR